MLASMWYTDPIAPVIRINGIEHGHKSGSYVVNCCVVRSGVTWHRRVVRGNIAVSVTVTEAELTSSGRRVLVMNNRAFYREHATMLLVLHRTADLLAIRVCQS